MKLVNSLEADEIRTLLQQVEAQYEGYVPLVVRDLAEVSYAGCDG